MIPLLPIISVLPMIPTLPMMPVLPMTQRRVEAPQMLLENVNLNCIVLFEISREPQ